MTSRRELFALAGAAAAAPQIRAEENKRRIHLAVSTYSYWHFKTAKYPIEKVIEEASDIGFDGVELLHRQFTDESPAYLNKLKRMAFTRGLSLPMLSIHQDFVSPDKVERDHHVKHTQHCIELASALGIPAIRLNSGRWKTIKSFDELMKVKGDEPPLSGYKLDDAFTWCIDSIKECMPAAEKAGVILCLENHWGLTTRSEALLRIWKAVNSPFLGINLDTGNWPGDENAAYTGIGQIAPYATIVQAKTYYGGGEWYTLNLDYKRIAGILRKAGYKGYISLEMEGKEAPEIAVRKSYKVLREAFG
jgi:L-ribulose-5-phosphate 3-epimerase